MDLVEKFAAGTTRGQLHRKEAVESGTSKARELDDIIDVGFQI